MRQLTVLIVDDNVRNRFLLSEMLSDLGHLTEIAENGQIAIDKLVAKPFDLVLLDVEMPVMNGIETAIHIRTRFESPSSEIPIVFITAHSVEDYFGNDPSFYFNDIITKPYSLENLVNILDKYFRD